MEKEEWKDIKGYEGLYQVSNLGRIKSLDRKCWNGNSFFIKKGIILKTRKHIKGYIEVNLYKNGKYKTLKVHRIVSIAFLENPNNFKEINHKDENKINNNVKNLEWCDRIYNLKYGNRIKKYVKKVKCIELNIIFESIKCASNKLNINHSSISACCKKKIKSAGKHPITKEKLTWIYA